MKREGHGPFQIAGEVVTTLVRYVGGQTLIALLLSFLYGVAFYLLSVPGWFLLAPLCGFFHLIPTLGVILGIAIPLLVVVIAGTSWSQVGGIVGVFITANLLETFVLTPVIHGKRFRLHPLAIFLAVITGGLLFGFLGAFFAVPVLAVLVLLWRHARAAQREV